MSTAGSGHRDGTIAHRVAGQGALLIAGFGGAQVLAFARNALLAWSLSRGAFGTAAAILLLLQMLEVMSDVGTERFLLQARDAERREVLAAAHTSLVLRGLVAAGLLLVLAEPAARLLAIGEASGTIMMVALVPVIKGFAHLDTRLAQRRLDNRASVAVELVPQAAALLLVLPVLHFDASYRAVAWLAIAQAVVSTLLTHALAGRSYRLGLHRRALLRLVSFGWPVWISSLTLIAVMQGDRMIVAAVQGVEALAAYTVVFLMTMVPGSVAGRLGHALLLPVLAASRGDDEAFRYWYRLTVHIATLLGAAQLTVLAIAGGALTGLVFGAAYADAGPLALAVGAMWALRMAQVAPTIALTARGETRPIMMASMVRAAALPLALVVALQGGGVVDIALAGVLGEVAALLTVANFIDGERLRLGRIAVAGALLLAPATALALLVGGELGPLAPSPEWRLSIAFATAATLAAIAFRYDRPLRVMALAALTSLGRGRLAAAPH
jgi:O-antigen/teichoic acid export membrane protein